MNFSEKIFSVCAILFAVALLSVLIMFPEYRQLKTLLPLSFAGLLVNIALMFIILRDIFMRDFTSSRQKYIWVFAVLLFWPSILYYLPRHGFKKRQAAK